ncbi:sugar transferase [Convivina intestini]|uniref:sugar transferase n=1 Tax=Convivina intestini TaxID=1505726 RepID=UPI00200DED19|nr:sugar transferase [Convivina intestini]
MTRFITQTIEPWMPLGALKAKGDYAKIAQSAGWQVLPLARYNDQRFDDQIRQEKINQWLQRTQPGDTVLHQFPTYMSASFEQSWLASLKVRQLRSVLLIHDIEPLRLHKADPWEFDLLKGYDLIITHSSAMITSLKEHGVTGSFVVQPFFDYLSESPRLARYSHTINFAGTFQKSPWLQEYNDYPIEVFGHQPKKWQGLSLPESIHLRGNYDPDQLPQELNNGFGLLWDDDFDDRYYRQYTRINAPHKASLYLSAGLPLIAWKKSAIGKIITKNQIGFTINRLEELPQVENISARQYENWQANLSPFREKISRGGFTLATLTQIKKQLDLI